ncbi:MAG: hypothetical protein NXI30_14495 [bacterium]|nr:hypothetical protein [bacterium]
MRGSVTAHQYFDAPGWIAVTIGAGLAAICLTVFGNRASRRFTGRDRRREVALVVALPLVLSFSVYSLGWLSHANAKSPAISASWQALHPALRLAVGTARLADADVVVTDIARSRSDYARMGLRPVRRSNHYVQDDGWVHAVDLRTRGRGPVRNALAHAWFVAMGFDTLRHAGTADHLHIALP